MVWSANLFTFRYRSGCSSLSLRQIAAVVYLRYKRRVSVDSAVYDANCVKLSSHRLHVVA